MEFEQVILEDLELLEIKPDSVSHTSDYFTLIEDYCLELIQKGLVYIDDTDVDTMRLERGAGVKSKCRDNTIVENIRRWDEMGKGSAEGKKNCARAKIEYDCLNKCMRDPVVYRCITDIPHHIHGFKYTRYPTYDFACPIVDSLEGVTHAMRSSEYTDRVPLYKWVQSSLNLTPVNVKEFSRLNFVNTVLSKRKLQWFVDNGYVDSWEDPRMPTVRGLLNRGLKIKALEQFILEQGPSKNVNLMEWDKLWSINRQLIDFEALRFMAVSAKDKVKVTLTNGPETRELTVRQLHSKNEEAGMIYTSHTKIIFIDKEDADLLKVGEKITLIKWKNAIVEKIEVSKNGSNHIFMRLNVNEPFERTEKKIHWVSKTFSIITIKEYGNLINKNKITDTDKMEDVVDAKVYKYEFFAESTMGIVRKGQVVQFKRRGYYLCETQQNPTQRGVFIKIPDGKMKPMSVILPKIQPAAIIKG